jgi:hypothetical protein
MPGTCTTHLHWSLTSFSVDSRIRHCLSCLVQTLDVSFRKQPNGYRSPAGQHKKQSTVVGVTRTKILNSYPSASPQVRQRNPQGEPQPVDCGARAGRVQRPVRPVGRCLPGPAGRPPQPDRSQQAHLRDARPRPLHLQSGRTAPPRRPRLRHVGCACQYQTSWLRRLCEGDGRAADCLFRISSNTRLPSPAILPRVLPFFCPWLLRTACAFPVCRQASSLFACPLRLLFEVSIQMQADSACSWLTRCSFLLSAVVLQRA